MCTGSETYSLVLCADNCRLQTERQTMLCTDIETDKTVYREADNVVYREIDNNVNRQKN